MPVPPDTAPAVGRRITIATVAIMACFVPAACDDASAGPARRATATKGPTTPKGPTTTKAPASGHDHGATATAEPADTTQDPTARPTSDPTAPSAPPAAGNNGLDPDGLQRGHFHTACRILSATDVAPDAAPVPAFFVATQDNGGGSRPDAVVVNVTGLPKGGAQCTVWAGDRAHRVPMMQRANQTPAIDSVRITVQ